MVEQHAERARAHELRVRDECRLRDDDAGDPLRLQLLRRRQPVQLLPYDVALFEFHPATTSPSAASPFARNSIASTRRSWICRSGPGGWICCAWSYSCCSCCAYCCRLDSRSACFSTDEPSFAANSCPSALELAATVRTLVAYEAYWACALFPWQAPTQKTNATMIAIAIAIRPTSRASGTRPVGGAEGRSARGAAGGAAGRPPPSPARRRSRTRCSRR